MTETHLEYVLPLTQVTIAACGLKHQTTTRDLAEVTCKNCLRTQEAARMAGQVLRHSMKLKIG